MLTLAAKMAVPLNRLVQGDDAGAPLAALGALRALHLGGTSTGDELLAALTFRIRLDSWSHDTGACSHGHAQLLEFVALLQLSSKIDWNTQATRLPKEQHRWRPIAALPAQE